MRKNIIVRFAVSDDIKMVWNKVTGKVEPHPAEYEPEPEERIIDTIKRPAVVKVYEVAKEDLEKIGRLKAVYNDNGDDVTGDFLVEHELVQS